MTLGVATRCDEMASKVREHKTPTKPCVFAVRVRKCLGGGWSRAFFARASIGQRALAARLVRWLHERRNRARGNSRGPLVPLHR